mgnify:FL=1|jgi:hypothetical protein
MKCNVGLQSIIIDTTTPIIKVYKCFSDILYNKNKPHLSLEIKDFTYNKLEKILKPTLCIHPKCICELFVPKFNLKIKDN